MGTKILPFKILLTENEELKFKRGSKIPQHPLLSQKQWSWIKSGKINHWTYYATTGDANHATHNHSITIYPEDY